MNRLLFIARNNLKKQKGDMITFFLLTLIAAFLIFDAASAILGVERVLDDRHAGTNGPDVLLIAGDSAEETECARRAFTENAHVKDYETTPVLYPTLCYRNAKEEEWNEYSFLIESLAAEKRYMLNRPEGAGAGKDEICVPLFLEGRFAPGDTLQVKLDGDVYDFTVAGYVEEPYFCSTVNITTYYSFMSQEMIDLLLTEHLELRDSGRIIHKAVLDRDSVPADYQTLWLENEITDRYKELIAPYSHEHPEHNYLNYTAVNWEHMRGGSGFIPMIVCGIVMLFAVIIFAVAVIIISFSIRNFIQRSMKDTGVLEANGYTVTELRAALLLQIGLVALAGTLAGIALGVLTFGTFGSVVSAVLGLGWNQPVNTAAAIVTAVALLFFVLLITARISRAYRKFTVLDALRGGISAHNYRKNHFSFEKTSLPVPAVLSLKDTMGNPGRNIALALVVAILTVSMLVGFGTFENFGKTPDRVIELMGFEAGTIAVSGGRELGGELRKLDGAENVLPVYGFEPTYSFGDREVTAYTYAVDDMENTTHTILIDGRMERHANEIMLTSSLAKDLNVRIGDVVTVTFGETSAEYLVTGLNQRMERMGRSGYLTFDGAERIIPRLTAVTCYVTAEEGETYDSMKAKVDALAAEKGETWITSDVGKEIEATMGTVSTAMRALCIGITILTVLVVMFVEALIVRAKIVREWRGMGVSKALGMTSGGLIAQIMLSSIPAVLAGILLGTLVSQPLGSRLCLAAFSLFSLEKVPFHIPAGYMVVTGLAILLAAVATAGVLGLKVRRIDPVEMITEE